MSKCVNFFRRFFVAFLTCVVTVISMAVAISPPVSAVGVFSPFNFYQLYQMLHGLLLGDGGGNSQTFGEWLEKNMTRTVGSGNNKQEFLITPGMKLEDMMSEASVRLMLGAALSDGGIAGASKMKDLIDSWTEVYDSSDIGEIGNFSTGSSSPFFLGSDGHSICLDSIYSLSENTLFPFGDYCFSFQPFVFSSKSWDTPISYQHALTSARKILVFLNDTIWICTIFANSDDFSTVNYNNVNNGYFGVYQYVNSSTGSGTSTLPLGNWSNKNFLYRATKFTSKSSTYFPYYIQGFDYFGLDVSFSSESSLDAWFSSTYSSLSFSQSLSDDFIGPVYAMPAAKQLITDTGTLSGLRLDVQTKDGTPDISAALDHAGVESVDDLVAGVAAGTIPMSQVYEDMRVVPYVLTDVETGEVVTDLNVSATDAKIKAVALDKDLSIPKDVSAVDAYQVTGKTWDPSLSKYKLPLFDFFPFCLPYDAYQFLTMLDVTPVAPVFQLDTTPLFSHTKFFHASDGYKITLDLTKYEEIFQILRAGECLAIVVGLCLISYKLIHGGD